MLLLVSFLILVSASPHIWAISAVEVPSSVSILATRTIDLTSQVVKISIEYEIKNEGNSKINYFVHAIDVKERKNLAWISASVSLTSGTKKNHANLEVTEVTVKEANDKFAFYKILFSSPLDHGSTILLVVDYSVTSVLKPYPSEITQGENQFIKYTGYANVLSAYKINKETTNVKTGAKPLSYSEVNPVKYVNEKIVYGPYENNKPFVKNPILIHYENNSPFLVATNVERVIEISHWGNIAVEEYIEIGSFSRLDFQMDRRGTKQPVIKSFKTILPSSAKDIYYRDEIGNISTSSVNERGNTVEVELRTRFPLYGGWKTNYVLGYNIPTRGFLYNSGSAYALKMKLLNHIFDNAVIENLLVKIILPEKSKITQLVTPYGVERLPDQVQKTYLDIQGRPVIVFKKKNLVNSHIKNFTLYYEFEYLSLIREPLIAVFAFFLLFLSVIIWIRFDFSISSKDEIWIKDKKE